MRLPTEFEIERLNHRMTIIGPLKSTRPSFIKLSVGVEAAQLSEMNIHGQFKTESSAIAGSAPLLNMRP